MHGSGATSSWVRRFADLVPAGGAVLDVAAGGGRHARFFLHLGHPVTTVDRDVSGLADLHRADATILAADLEDGPWPLRDRRFAGVIVTNYLHRPLLPDIVASVAPAGCLIYETFALGNERFGKPSNPDFLLRPGELLEAVRGRLTVVAYENLEVAEPKPALVQRIAAVAPT
ncbi:MAG: class I SAM-dependent methyltransferase [Dongiaceae bacterium]